MTIQKLSVTPKKDEYIAFEYSKAKLDRFHVNVTTYTTRSRGGTWMTGFRFYTTTWAMLERKNVIQEVKIPYSRKKRKIKVNLFSADHGKTWHTTEKAAMKSKGKTKLNSSNEGELAFHSIQKLNRRDFGSGYKWKR